MNQNDTMRGASFIELRGVTKTYRVGKETVSALDDISLTINKGELVAVVGPSGSGKTTFAHTIGGLIRPTSGALLIEGKQLDLKSDQKISQYRNTFVGFVFQNYSLLPNYTVLENVALPLLLAKVLPTQRRVRAQRYLKSVGLSGFEKRRANELSGGQRQRVSIARALVSEPKVIIADEPTGNLDSAKGKEIMMILQKLSHEQGITVIMVTHDDHLATLADRIIHLKDGRLQVGKYAV